MCGKEGTRRAKRCRILVCPHKLTLFGAPGMLVNVAALGELREPFIRDLFGDYAEQIPTPDRWPALQNFLFGSVPEEAGNG